MAIPPPSCVEESVGLAGAHEDSPDIAIRNGQLISFNSKYYRHQCSNALNRLVAVVCHRTFIFKSSDRKNVCMYVQVRSRPRGAMSFKHHKDIHRVAAALKEWHIPMGLYRRTNMPNMAIRRRKMSCDFQGKDGALQEQASLLQKYT